MALDVELPVTPELAEAAARLLEQLEVAERRPELLTPLPTPVVVEFRRWYLGQFAAQLAGEAPVSWPDWRAAALGR